VIGKDFGVTTDIVTAPNGNVFVVSLSNGAVYEIKSKPSLLFVANLNGDQEVPPTNSPSTGTATLLLSPDETEGRVSLNFSGLPTSETAAHIHGPATLGVSGPVLFPLPLGQVDDFQITLTPAQVQDLKNGLLYINVHSTTFPNGEIRGQFASALSNSSVQFSATGYTVNEGAGTVTVTASRIGNNSQPATVHYATLDGTAKNLSDYVGSSGTIQFAPGETVKQLQIAILDDTYVEATKSFTIVLNQPAIGVTPGSPFTTTITVLDDDRPALFADDTEGRAIALSSVTMLSEPFHLSDIHNLGTDQRTRIMLFISGIDDNSLSLFSAKAEGPNNHVYPLIVEDVRKVPNFDSLWQVTVQLPASIDSSGDFGMSISYRGRNSNRALIGFVE